MSKSDNSLFIRSDSKGQVFIIIYVDDLVIGGEHLVDIEHIKKLLSSRFEMKDMKELHYFLGIEVIRTPDDIMLSQRHYILNLLYKFGMTECKPVTTPIDRNLKLDVDSGTTKYECECLWNYPKNDRSPRSIVELLGRSHMQTPSLPQFSVLHLESQS